MPALKALNAAMTDISITKARSCLAQLVQQAERGQPVRITRRGRPVAVLVSLADHARLHTGRVGLLAYSQTWRKEAAAAGVPTADETDWTGLRDQRERPAPDLA